MGCFMSKIMTAFEIFLAHEFVTWDKFAKVFSAADNGGGDGGGGGLSHVNCVANLPQFYFHSNK